MEGDGKLPSRVHNPNPAKRPFLETFNSRRNGMKRFQKIIGGFQKIINKLDKLKAKCDKKAMKIALKVDKLHEKRVGQIQEGLLAKTAADNLKDIFPQPKNK